MNGFAWWLAQNAAVTALLVPVVWAFCRLRRSRPAEQHLLWLLLLFKLMTPPVVLWPEVTGDVAFWTAAAPVVEAVAPSFDRPAGPAEPLSEALASAPDRPDSTREPMLVEPMLVDPPAPEAAASEVDLWMPPAPPAAPEAPVVGEIAFDVAATVWLAGAIIVLLRLALHTRRQRTILRTARDAPAALGRLVEELATELRLRAVPVRVSPRVDSPFVSCFGRPVLVWPARLSGDEFAVYRGVIAHELAHLCRGDHWVVRLEAVASILWWWNPVFWFLRRRLEETRELACDALALERADSDRRAFAELLLAFSAPGRPALPFASLRTGIAPRHPFRRRLTMLFDDSVSGRVSRPGLALAALLGLAALPGWAVSQEEPPAETAPADAALAPLADPAAAAAPRSAPANPPAADPAAVPPVPASIPADAASPPDVAAPSPEGPPTPAAAPPHPPASTPSPPANWSSPMTREVKFDDGKVIVLERSREGNTVFLHFMRDGKSIGSTVTLQDPSAASSGEPWRVYYFTAGWSAPDRRMTPVIETLKNEGFPIEIVDVDRSRDLVEKFRVSGIPTLVAMRGEHEGGRLVGLQEESRIRRLINMLSDRNSRDMSAAPPSLVPPPSVASSEPLGPPAATPPARTASRSGAEVKLLENALELAKLEVEEKSILLEQGRADDARRQELREKGFLAKGERSQDLRLLELDLRQAMLKVEQAQIQLDAARSAAK